MPRTQRPAEQGSTAGADAEARAGSKVEAKGRLLRTETRPSIVEAEPCVLPGGDFSTFRRKFIWQIHSSKFVGKPIPRVESTQDYVEKRMSEANSYKRHAGHSLTVETEDGYGLVVLIKRGMYDNVPRGMEKEIRERSENAFRNLANAYPPIIPGFDDYRHAQALKDVSAWKDRGLSWGRTHFMYWCENGHSKDPPRLSAHACPDNPAQLEAVKKFIEEVLWENEPIGKMMALSDSESKEKFHRHTQTLRQDGLLKHLDQGPHAVNSSLVALFNTAVQPHRDPKDARDGWTSTNTWGNYEGAWAVFPDLGIMIEQEPGDIMLCRSHYLEHWITEIISGERYCCTRMTKENVINPLEPWVRCPVPGCVWISGRVSSLRPHVQTEHFGLTDMEVKEIMDTIHKDFPEYSAKDTKAISSILRARMAEQEKQKEKGKTKRGPKGDAERTESVTLDNESSGDDDIQASSSGQWLAARMRRASGAVGDDEKSPE